MQARRLPTLICSIQTTHSKHTSCSLPNAPCAAQGAARTGSQSSDKADRVRGLQDRLLKRHSGEQAARPAAPSMLWSLAEGVVPEAEASAEPAPAAVQQVICPDCSGCRGAVDHSSCRRF